MRSTTALFYLCLLFAFTFQSCSIEKRRYTTGYSFQWKKNNPTVKTTNTDEALTLEKQEAKKKEVIPTSKGSIFSDKKTNSLTASTNKKNGIVLFAPDSLGCDTIFMRNQDEIKAKVIEITPTEIKYKNCDNITGPTYVTYRYNVSYIKYANGKLDSFKNEYAPPSKRTGNLDSFKKEFGPPTNRRKENYESIEERQVKNMSTSGLVFGILSVFLFLIFLTSIAAIILGALSLKRIKKDLSLLRYKNRAIAALVLGIITLLLFILVILLIARSF